MDLEKFLFRFDGRPFAHILERHNFVFASYVRLQDPNNGPERNLLNELHQHGIRKNLLHLPSVVVDVNGSVRCGYAPEVRAQRTYLWPLSCEP